ncbi:MAG: rod shape-determining protein RodA [Armatimonadetes bacterium]|nr:rod shape-determining protein RodA [Armatimonadota bacterium]
MVLSSRLARHFEYTLLSITGLIAAAGLVLIFSASGQNWGYVAKQIIGLLVGGTALLAVASIPPIRLIQFSRPLYLLTLLALVAVLFFGNSAKGSVRWIPLPGGFNLQPSEFAKVALMITLAAFLYHHHERIRDFSTVMRSLAHIGIPLALVFKQPDLGTTLVLGAIWLGMMFVAGARWQHLLAVILATGIFFGAAWHFNILKDYQKKRLIIFINPNEDPLESGYHIIQSRIAIGSGRLMGKGLLHGTQNRLEFLPEQHTDFIFAVLGEELGFVGSCGLLSLYLLLLLRAVAILRECEEMVGQWIGAGVLSLFLFHIVVNIGMTIGIMPVTGVTLPFVSYGPSSVIASCLSLGLLVGIWAYRHEIAF